MASLTDQRLASLGIDLPEAPPPAGNYVPAARAGNLLFISGQIPREADGRLHKGTLGAGTSVEDGVAAARLCAVNILAQVRAHLGDLDRVRGCVKVTGFVASAPGFGDQPRVLNGASDLLAEVLGERGRHARAAVGVAALPLGVSVEVEAIFEVE